MRNSCGSWPRGSRLPQLLRIAFQGPIVHSYLFEKGNNNPKNSNRRSDLGSFPGPQIPKKIGCRRETVRSSILFTNVFSIIEKLYEIAVYMDLLWTFDIEISFTFTLLGNVVTQKKQQRLAKLYRLCLYTTYQTFSSSYFDLE